MPTSSKTGIPYPTAKKREWFEDFRDTIEAIDQRIYAAREDRNIMFTGGGTFAFNAGTGVLSWSAAIEIFSPIAGFNWIIPAGNVTVADTQVVYATITRRPTQNITMSFALAANLSLANGDDALAFGIRKGSIFHTLNGRAISSGQSFALLQASSLGGSGGGGNYQAFTYTCSGSEGDDFFISFPSARANENYTLAVTKSGGATLYAFDAPNDAPSDRTTTQFRVTTAVTVTAGDKFDIIAIDNT